MLILEDEVNSIFTSIVQAPLVQTVWINQAPLLRRSTISMLLSRLWIEVLMCRIVVDVHPARIWILRENIFIQLRNFIPLIDELLGIAEVLFHHQLPGFHEVPIEFSHPQEDRRSLDHETDVHSHEVTAENMLNGWIIVVFIDERAPGLLQFLSILINILINSFIKWFSTLIKAKLSIELPLLPHHVIVISDERLLLHIFRWILDRDFAGFTIIGHFRLFIIELSLRCKHFQYVNFSNQFVIHSFYFSEIIGKASCLNVRMKRTKENAF